MSCVRAVDECCGHSSLLVAVLVAWQTHPQVQQLRLVVDGVEAARRLDIMAGGANAPPEHAAVVTCEGHAEVVEILED